MKIYKYIIPGNPIAELKVLEADTPRIWDEYKQKRFNFEQYLRNQHGEKSLFDEPIIIEAVFYYKTDRLADTPAHRRSPTIHSLYSFLAHVLKGTIYRKHCEIYETALKKILSDEPRTELTIKTMGS